MQQFIKDEVKDIKDEVKGIKDEVKEEVKGIKDEVKEEVKEEVGKVSEALDKFVVAQYAAKAVGSKSQSESQQSKWQTEVHNRYGMKSGCVVLSYLFPETAKQTWYGEHIFKAVCEHIIPKDDKNCAKLWKIGAWENTNGLPLLKHLEETFQAFLWTFDLKAVSSQPQSITVQIKVSQQLRGHEIRYEPPDRSAVHVLCNGVWKKLTFGDLHCREIQIRPPPSLRSLLAKALGAYQMYPNEYSNPQRHLDLYKKGCRMIEDDLFQRMKVRAEAPDSDEEKPPEWKEMASSSSQRHNAKNQWVKKKPSVEK